MTFKINDLITYVQNKENPQLIANKLSYYLSGELKVGKISLYEAYQINAEILRLRRETYVGTGWNGRVSISTCISYINQKMLAEYFEDDQYAETLERLAFEAEKLNGEKRSHYILDDFGNYVGAAKSHEMLKKLSMVRETYIKNSDENGPFHNEVFPFHFYEPENMLLDSEEREIDKNIKSEIEDLLVELSFK